MNGHGQSPHGWQGWPRLTYRGNRIGRTLYVIFVVATLCFLAFHIWTGGGG